MNRFKLGEPLDSIVRKHLLTFSSAPLNEYDIEIAIHKGWYARDEEIKELESKLSQARNAFILIEKGSANRYPQPCFYDHDEINKIAREALKEIE